MNRQHHQMKLYYQYLPFNYLFKMLLNHLGLKNHIRNPQQIRVHSNHIFNWEQGHQDLVFGQEKNFQILEKQDHLDLLRNYSQLIPIQMKLQQTTLISVHIPLTNQQSIGQYCQHQASQLAIQTGKNPALQVVHQVLPYKTDQQLGIQTQAPLISKCDQVQVLTHFPSYRTQPLQLIIQLDPDKEEQVVSHYVHQVDEPEQDRQELSQASILYQISFTFKYEDPLAEPLSTIENLVQALFGGMIVVKQLTFSQTKQQIKIKKYNYYNCNSSHFPLNMNFMFYRKGYQVFQLYIEQNIKRHRKKVSCHPIQTKSQLKLISFEKLLFSLLF
ncbi:hypothetical protein TTHERM_000059499 (macronuclear) [Tetrahymena thermophila SB210]|uniref:Uncharacterized protein n=1 Tax=Tetrahymena thermophila (strain SB210) TaxID=312017 RepID=W7XH57_TETTS|nr:hypothetical protein TTHERM_000059499 [Tetrahymena thermophila SB210]EWS76488.1 hypothetical protein TTHERM_000059499 [Tetrahymena thermophila SB210]|eukprot:XP_012650978.1 hypothetical protein TTHERM_000059499 [Tetrahymena thermophila SB210]